MPRVSTSLPFNAFKNTMSVKMTFFFKIVAGQLWFDLLNSLITMFTTSIMFPYCLIGDVFAEGVEDEDDTEGSSVLDLE